MNTTTPIAIPSVTHCGGPQAARGVRSTLLAFALAAGALAVQAQDAAPPDWSGTRAETVEGWTGDLQGLREARKETAAALAQGRAECGRSRGESRTACLKKVQEDYAESLKRLQASITPRR